MAIQRFEMILVASAMLCITGVMALSSSSSSSSSCITVLISLSPCLNYLSKNSSIPSSRCCTQLETVVQSSPRCICEAYNGGETSSLLNLDQSRVVGLPIACDVQTPPPLSMCNDGSPSDSPAGFPENQNRVPPPNSMFKTIPLTNNGSSSKMAISLFFVAISIAYFGSSVMLF